MEQENIKNQIKDFNSVQKEISHKEQRIRKITQLYYSRKDVQKAIFEFSKDREICPQYFEGFGKRPDSFQYTGDIFELVKRGATSFHCSEELWDDPLKIFTGMNEKQSDELRIGWDLLIDIDCKWFDYSKLAAKAIIQVLKRHNIKNMGLKFSGSKGWHILVPWKSFPKKIGDSKTKDLFPELPRKIVDYIRFEAQKILNKNLPEDFAEQFKNVEIKKGIRCLECNEISESYDKIDLHCSPCGISEIRKLRKSDDKKYFCPNCKRELEERDRKPVTECLRCDSTSDISDARKRKGRFAEFIETDLFELMGLDLILVSPRHLFRMPYSVDFNESVCVKKGQKIKIVKIGEFADQFFKSKKDLQIEEISDLGYETISLDIEKNKTQFSKINKVIRHKINEEMFNIKLKSGREVKATSGHSLFILRNGKIKTIKGNNVKQGDYLVALRKINMNEDLNKINLADELVETLKKEKKNIFLYDFSDSIFEEVYNLNIPKRKFEQRYNWKVYNILPLDVYGLLIQKKPSLKNHFKKSKIKYSKHGGGTRGLPNYLKMDKDLMRLLGYYVSEGHCDIARNRIAFSFGAHEKELINDCKKILKNLNMNPITEKPHDTATQIVVNSPILKLILSSLFKCGKHACEKRVPSVLWNLKEKLKIEFLNSYIKGDGHLEKKWAKIIISTASKRLQEDLCFLLSSLGRGYSINKRKPTKWNKTNKDQYIIIIQGKRDVEKLGFTSKSKRTKESLINKFPIKELGLEKPILNSRWKNQYINKKIIERNKDFIEKLNPSEDILNLIHGDASFLKIKEIKRITPKHEYVYDISVENDENFVGGNCILLHNSLHEKTALASVVLSPEEIDNFQLKDADPMKVKVRNFMPDAEEGEAKELVIQALDWDKDKKIKSGESNEKITGKYADYKPIKLDDLSEKNFPPCVQKILKGLADGKKRAVFALINLFRSVGMEKDELEKRIYNWNKKNNPSLKEGYIKSQLSWSYRKKPIMPSNCKEFYQGIGVCLPDELCRLIKNPVNYVVRKNFIGGKKTKNKDNLKE